MLNFREYKIVFFRFGEFTRSSASGFTAADEKRLPVCHEPAFCLSLLALLPLFSLQNEISSSGVLSI